MGSLKCSSLPLQHSRANRLMEGSAKTWRGSGGGGRRKRKQNFTSSSLTSVVRHDARICPLQINFPMLWGWIMLLSKCNGRKKKSTSTKAAHRAETYWIYQWLCHQSTASNWHRPDTVSRSEMQRGLCLHLKNFFLIQFVSLGPWFLFINPVYLFIDGTGHSSFQGDLEIAPKVVRANHNSTVHRLQLAVVDWKNLGNLQIGKGWKCQNRKFSMLLTAIPLFILTILKE